MRRFDSECRRLLHCPAPAADDAEGDQSAAEKRERGRLRHGGRGREDLRPETDVVAVRIAEHDRGDHRSARGA